MCPSKLNSTREGTKKSRSTCIDDLVLGYREKLIKLESHLANGRSSPTTFKRAQEKLAKETDSLLIRLDALDGLLGNQKERQRARAHFRALLKSVLKQNPFIMRCLDKPQGYPGDFMMMEVGYEDQADPDLGIGPLDRYFIDKYYSIILRKEKVKARIKNLLSSGRPKEVVRVLTIGGGPAREWFELEKELGGQKNLPKVRLIYLDQDGDAMAFAAKRLDNNSLLASVNYRKESLFEFSKSGAWQQQNNSYDLIYGIGIADYFYDRVLTGIVAQCTRLARVGGEVLITHKDHNAFPFTPADWLCDWTFVHRSKADFKSLLQEAVNESKVRASISVDHEPSGEILFGYLRRSGKN